MPVTERQDKFLHTRLPIDADETILAVWRHHWFAYASLWIIGTLGVVLIFVLAGFLAFGIGGDSAESTNKTIIFVVAGLASGAAVLFTLVPVYLRSQEQVVLTEEAVLQILQPSLFASKTSQLNLAHIADVSVQKDFLGTIFGYGRITVETPGEQNNYIFAMLSAPETVAKQIIAAHENFQAAVESGKLPTTLGTEKPEAPQIDPEQYAQFLQYQKMVAQQQKDAAQQPAPPADQTDQTKQ
jgi:hypothetical protein